MSSRRFVDKVKELQAIREEDSGTQDELASGYQQQKDRSSDDFLTTPSTHESGPEGPSRAATGRFGLATSMGQSIGATTNDPSTTKNLRHGAGAEDWSTSEQGTTGSLVKPSTTVRYSEVPKFRHTGAPRAQESWPKQKTAFERFLAEPHSVRPQPSAVTINKLDSDTTDGLQTCPRTRFAEPDDSETSALSKLNIKVPLATPVLRPTGLDLRPNLGEMIWQSRGVYHASQIVQH